MDVKAEVTKLVSAIEAHVVTRVNTEMRARIQGALGLNTKPAAASKAAPGIGRGQRHCGKCNSEEHDARNHNKAIRKAA